MDKISKALTKLTTKEREKILSLLKELKVGKSEGLDIKKLKGRDDIFRVRKGALRVIYRVLGGGAIVILEIARRSDTTYK